MGTFAPATKGHTIANALDGQALLRQIGRMMTRAPVLAIFSLLTLAACKGEASSPAPSSEPTQQSAPSMSAEAQKGRALFGDCAVCHQVDPARGHRIGPNLYGVYGAPAARHPDFRYSKALQRAGITWDEDSLDQYLESPQSFVKGGRMAYRGMKDPEDRAAMIAYLKTLTDEAE
ncbi:MAG: cytochrome c family protein [Pseudomonadota bacterium]